MQKVLITAGASGLGKAMATAFDATHASIWIVDIDEQALQNCPDRWNKTRLDVLCSNAGIAGPTAKLEVFNRG